MQIELVSAMERDFSFSTLPPGLNSAAARGIQGANCIIYAVLNSHSPHGRPPAWAEFNCGPRNSIRARRVEFWWLEGVR